MPSVPIAAFLAGALLTILLPLGLLIALSVWYWGFSVRAPEAIEDTEPGTPLGEVSPPGPTVVEKLPPDPAV